MNIQNRNSICKPEAVQNLGITCEPKWLQAFMAEREFLAGFPGWDEILILATEQNIWLARTEFSLIAIEIEATGHDALVFCDGRREMVVPAGGRLEVTRCATPLKWVRLDSAPFTDRLVRKFRLPVTGWRGQ